MARVFDQVSGGAWATATLGAGRVWLFRAVAIALPLALLGAVELSLRVVGVGAPGARAGADPWANPLVGFEAGTSVFPEWDETVTMPKPAGTYRIFVVGGSSAAGFGVEVPFSKILGDELRKRRPHAQIEVVNGGIPAAGSHRVYEAVRRTGAFAPDLVVYYGGHNEFLEDVFYSEDGLLSRLERTRDFARNVHLVNVIRGLTGGALDAKTEGEKPILKSRFLGTMAFPLIKGADQYASKLRFLEANLDLMADFAAAHGARFVVVPAEPAPLVGPSWPEHGPGFEKSPDAWNAAYSAAKTALREKRWTDAEKHVAEMHLVDDQFAMSHYLRGFALLGQDKTAEAALALRRAILLDKNGDRSNDDIERVILGVAARRALPSLSLRARFDAELPADFARVVDKGGLEDFLSARKDGIETFLDHCHPSQRGHQIIAEEIARFLDEKVL